MILERLMQDTTWIYTGIAGSILGAAFLAYFKDTNLGLWCYAKFDLMLDFLRDRYGLIWFDQPDDAWRKRYPHIKEKIDNLESRLENLEKKQNGKSKHSG